MSIRVPLSECRTDPRQPSTYFRAAALNALATSIKKSGQRQAITVRALPPGGKHKYEIVDGERRWRACKIAGLLTVRAEIEEREISSHADQHLLSLTSNFMREGHTHTEISIAVQYQVDSAMSAGKTRGQAIQLLGESIGKSEAWVYNYLQLQHLCIELQARLHPDTPDDKRLRFNEAVVLAPLTPTRQKEIYRKLLSYPPGVRALQAKRLVASATGTPVQRRTNNVKVSTSRFVVRVSAEIERVLDYKESEFRVALAELPAEDRKAFRSSVALLLDAIDRAGRGSGHRGAQ